MAHNATTENKARIQKHQTLGSIRLHTEGTDEIILILTPSSDTNDPLIRSKSFRLYIAFITCATIFVSQSIASAPTVTIVQIVIDLLGTLPTDPDFVKSLGKVAYLFTTIALMQGMSNLLYMPLNIKYERRIVYLGSFTLYATTALWAGLAKSYNSELAARILMGFAAGSVECLSPMIIANF